MTMTTNQYITAEQLDQYDRDGFVVLPAVFKTFPNLQLAEADPTWRATFSLRGLQKLMVQG